ncbi:MAG TPA: hypothetical protein VG498_07385 [Terriglobales bacterium]|nr:hypothetical protein [Terriglobales bacterium]
MMNSAAYEAFRTVSAVNGNFARLAYLASMQDAPGLYRHWGLEREFGEEEVSRAFAHSHRVVLETILQTDVSELVGDLKLGAEEQGKTVPEFIHHLLSAPLVRTIGLPLHTEKHFKFVLQSLRSLALSRA